MSANETFAIGGFEGTEALQPDDPMFVDNGHLRGAHCVVAAHVFRKELAMYMPVDADRMVDAFLFHETAQALGCLEIVPLENRVDADKSNVAFRSFFSNTSSQ